MSSALLEETTRRFLEDPASARTAPAVTAALANGHVRLSAGAFNWESDLPASIGGNNQAPSPTAYLLGALAGCAVAFVNDTLAPQFDVEIEDVTAIARGAADLAGLLGVDGARPDLHDVTIDIEITSPSPDARVQAMQRAWLERCPVYLALVRASDVAVSFSRPGARS
jgi:uncharacterized OsmC-like protein